MYHAWLIYLVVGKIEVLLHRHADDFGSNARQTGTAVADAAGNIFVAFTNMSDRVLKFNSEGTYITGTQSGIDGTWDEFVLATNGQDIYVASADGADNWTPKIIVMIIL